jgi:hypothetical protein
MSSALKLAIKTACASALACILFSPSTVQSAAKNDAVFAVSKPNPQSWAVTGGTLTVLFNPDLLQDVGLSVEAEGQQRRAELQAFTLAVQDQAHLQFEAPNGSVERLLGGSLKINGSFTLRGANASKSFADFSVRPRAGSERDLELLDSEGAIWFVTDHVHYELVDNKTRLSMRNMDLRMTDVAAQFFGDVSLAGLNVGSLNFSALVQRSGTVRIPEACGDPNWHNKLIDPNNPNGPRYQADVLLIGMSSLDYKRCTGCDGPGGASDGSFVMAPNASLQNSDTATTADLPWYTKFQGNFQPHNNDQHPYLVWNIYRVEKSTGNIVHIGRSGVKHAFLTINTGCSQYNCGDNHILWRLCGDVYSSGNNDSTNDLGPRSEIIPSKGLWGRCGSIYDPGCTGTQSGSGGTNTSNRLILKETQVSDTTNFDYYYEGWYVIRDDVNIFNNMGFKKFTPSYVSNQWRSLQESAFTQGAFIDTWAAAAPAPLQSRVTELLTSDGRAKLAVRVTQSGGEYVYQYALHNFDYTKAQTEQSGPSAANLRILSQSALRGIDFGMLRGVTSMSVEDGNADKANWTQVAGSNEFRAPNATDELSWGNLMSFTIRSVSPPVAQAVSISGDSGVLGTVSTLVPNSSNVGNVDTILANGFEQ